MFACFHILCFKHLLLFLYNPSDLLSPFPTNQGSQLLCCGPTGSCVSILHPQQREGSRWILSGKGESLEASLRSDSSTFCVLCVAWPGMEHDWLPHDPAAMPSPPLWVMHFQTVNNPSSPLKWLLVRYLVMTRKQQVQRCACFRSHFVCSVYSKMSTASLTSDK